jgi:hypothetical protein
VCFEIYAGDVATDGFFFIFIAATPIIANIIEMAKPPAAMHTGINHQLDDTSSLDDDALIVAVSGERNCNNIVLTQPANVTH